MIQSSTIMTETTYHKNHCSITMMISVADWKNSSTGFPLSFALAVAKPNITEQNTRPVQIIKIFQGFFKSITSYYIRFYSLVNPSI